jgi:hypothetical protein
MDREVAGEGYSFLKKAKSPEVIADFFLRNTISMKRKQKCRKKLAGFLLHS